MRACICPNCGANLSIDDKDREFAFCQFCGTKILLNETIIHKTVDETEVKRIEYDAKIRMKELEAEDKKLEAENKKRSQSIKALKYCIPTAIIIGLCSFFFDQFELTESFSSMLFLINSFLVLAISAIIISLIPSDNEVDKTTAKAIAKEKTKQAKYAGLVMLPKLSEEYKKKDFQEIVSIFEKAGFENITTTKKYRMSLGLRNKTGTVDKILVDGRELDLDNYFQFHKHYDPSVLVEIFYYSN